MLLQLCHSGIVIFLVFLDHILETLSHINTTPPRTQEILHTFFSPTGSFSYSSPITLMATTTLGFPAASKNFLPVPYCSRKYMKCGLVILFGSLSSEIWVIFEPTPSSLRRRRALLASRITKGDMPWSHFLYSSAFPGLASSAFLM